MVYLVMLLLVAVIALVCSLNKANRKLASKSQAYGRLLRENLDTRKELTILKHGVSEVESIVGLSIYNEAIFLGRKVIGEKPGEAGVLPKNSILRKYK